MAGKIIADIIEAPYDAIRMNVANVTVLTANSSGLTYIPTGNVNVNIGSTASLTLGNVTVSNIITASAIKFPATQVSSADANTLDDYEEGTWTPTASRDITAPTLTYTTRSGSYVKIGKIVIANMAIITGTVSSAGSGNMIVTGLPFSSSEPSYSGQGMIGYNDALSNAVYAAWMSSATIYFRSGTRSQGNDNGGWASNGYLNLTMIYQTN